jgi:hypothetical protein
LHSQVTYPKSWCASKCRLAGDEMSHTKEIFMSLNNNKAEIRSLVASSLKFPLRIAIVGKNKPSKNIEKSVKSTIDKLNKGFENTSVSFNIDKIEFIPSSLTIENLQENGFEQYNAFSQKHDLSNMISIYVFDFDTSLCKITPTSISCGRTGGFSYILSTVTNNVVLSQFDLEDDKVIVHEMGHFFGLYHTFEEDQFGKDNFVEDCNVAGDCLCDTPPDPGPVYEVYINHSLCKTIGLSHENGNIYNPLVNNYMAYFKPCYLIPYTFTQGQSNVILTAAKSSYRKPFSR